MSLTNHSEGISLCANDQRCPLRLASFLTVQPYGAAKSESRFDAISREDAVADLFSLLKKAGYAILIPIKSIACVRI